MVYVLIAVGLLVGVALVLRYTLSPPIPRTITSLVDAERLVNYYIEAANRRLRREAWRLTFVVAELDLEKRTVAVRVGIQYGRRGYPDYAGRFAQMWANAHIMLQAKERISEAFSGRGLRAHVETFT